ncbi:MAG: 2-C-methyl-D-erythritol 4-phosphate cytidylyltransferase [Cyclobacteriaceae bacterium]
MTQKEHALIVAGGKGTRFGSEKPKQFLELNGKPVLLHTLEAFYRYSDKINVVLVLPGQDIITWQEISKKYHFNKPLIIEAGGSTRFHSVKKGLEKINDDGFVAIHDGVRPLVSAEIIESSFRLARLHQSAVAAVRSKDSIRMIDDYRGVTSPAMKTKAVDRSLYRLIQTPQTFAVALIKNAYSIQEDSSLTDDASVAERAGHPVFLFEGSYDNLKITTPEDLIIAQALLKNRSGL